MSIVILSALLATAPRAETGPLPNWTVVAALPNEPARPRNEVRLDGNRLLWNGEEASEALIRTYLSVVKSLDPQPPTVLSHGTQVAPHRVDRMR